MFSCGAELRGVRGKSSCCPAPDHPNYPLCW